MLRKGKVQKKTAAPKGLKVAIVAACYNPSLTDALLRATVETLSKSGVHHPKIVRVPGSYEVPVVVAKLARSRRYEVIIALGVVLQGKTSHAEHITLSSTLNLQRLSLETGIPIIHQILTPRNLRDARARVRMRGVEAAQVAIEMAGIIRAL
jgi:6,7-dimethyl-8-ribityllumazine synthase